MKSENLLTTWLKSLQAQANTIKPIKIPNTVLDCKFIPIPDAEVTVMAVTVMRNNKREWALEKSDFGKLMNILERRLGEAKTDYMDADETPVTAVFIKNGELFFQPIDGAFGKFDMKKWHSALNCHRCFFIPKKSVEITKNRLFSKGNVAVIKQCKVQQIAASGWNDSSEYFCEVYA